MPTARPTDADHYTQTLQARPLTVAQQPKPRPVGRPEKLVMPPLPEMRMTDLERDLFDYFLASYQQQYPDLVPTDFILLHLAALEYIKWLRIIAEELETGRVISQARQHPAVNMRGGARNRPRNIPSPPTSSRKHARAAGPVIGYKESTHGRPEAG